MSFPKKQVSDLKDFINALKAKPELLHEADLGFFRDYLTSLGAKIPSKPEAKPTPKAAPKAAPAADDFHDMPPLEEVGPEPTQPSKPSPAASKPSASPKAEEKKVEEEEEKAPEFKDDNLWKADNDAPLEMGDPSKTASEDDEDEAFGLMSEGRSALKKGNYSLALEKLTEAIKKNANNAIFFATRAEILVEMKKGNAAIRDATRAVEINPDSNKALKARGKALRYLGKYEEAFHDLTTGNKIDWDEETDKLVKELQPHIEALGAYRRRKEERERDRKLKERQDAHARASQGHGHSHEHGGHGHSHDDDDMEEEDDFSGMGGGMGGMPGGMPPGMAAAMNDPEVQAALRDPDVMAKLTQAMGNPAMLGQLMNDPKVGKVIRAMMGGMGGAGGMGGMGGMGGFPGGGAGGSAGGAAGHTDDDLD